jgi:hypothetical protein
MKATNYIYWFCDWDPAFCQELNDATAGGAQFLFVTPHRVLQDGEVVELQHLAQSALGSVELSPDYVWNRLNAGDLCLYDTISRTREEVIADLRSKGWNVSPFINAGVLRIIDYLALAEDKPGTPEERLTIMRDSRVGGFGVVGGSLLILRMARAQCSGSGSCCG